MNAINAAFNAVFNALLMPLELLGVQFSLIAASGVFGILALVIFKRISSQKGIKASKDKIKGHMIEIRLYQDDLALVSKAILKVLGRNAQYVTFNFAPILPLLLPFAFVMAQFVVRYGFAPVPVVENPSALMAGEGTMLHVELASDRKAEASQISFELPDGLVAPRPMVRAPGVGKAFLEVFAVKSGVHEIKINLAGGKSVTKIFVAGEATQRLMQPERTGSALEAILWPAEAVLDADTGVERIAFVYPDSDLGWLPGGLMGVMIVFVVASMIVGGLMLKPLGIEI